MRALLALLVTALAAAPVRSDDLADLTPYVPEGSDFVAALQLDPGSLPTLASSLALSPKATAKVLEEQCQEFARDTGFNPSDVTTILVAGNRAGTQPPLILAKARLDLAKVSAALKVSAKAHGLGVSEEKDRVLVVSGPGDRSEAAALLAGGIVIAGTADRVKRAVSAPARPGAAEAQLISGLARHAAGSRSLTFQGTFPKGVEVPLPPPLSAQVPAPLLAKVRAVFAGGRPGDYALAITFDSADTAAASQQVVAGLLRSLQGAVDAKANQSAALAKAKGPLGALDATLLASKSLQVTVQELIAALSIKPSGNDLVVSLPRDRFAFSGTTLVVGIAAAIAIPQFQQAQAQAQIRKCHANQKTIAGAIEMYKLDKNKKEIGELTPEFLAVLRKDGYLINEIEDPGEGPGSARNYYGVKEGNGVACRVHGSFRGSAEGAGGQE